ncbi:hypothetical protein ACLOJK_014481 [Asimina triloba]
MNMRGTPNVEDFSSIITLLGHGGTILRDIVMDGIYCLKGLGVDIRGLLDVGARNMRSDGEEVVAPFCYSLVSPDFYHFNTGGFGLNSDQSSDLHDAWKNSLCVGWDCGRNVNLVESADADLRSWSKGSCDRQTLFVIKFGDVIQQRLIGRLTNTHELNRSKRTLALVTESSLE